MVNGKRRTVKVGQNRLRRSFGGRRGRKRRREERTTVSVVVEKRELVQDVIYPEHKNWKSSLALAVKEVTTE